jgi:molecular chaperone GrpE
VGLELPDQPEEAIDLLLRALKASQEESSNYLSDLKRVAADFDNYRKRAMREQTVMLDRAAERVIQKLLPALDSFDAAVNTEVESEAGKQLLAGMLGTREQLLNALAEEGLRVIPTVGEEFDPEVHEPVGAAQGDGSPVVAQELRRGYQLNDRLVRAALVTLESTGS